jgi:hypothetical protein
MNKIEALKYLVDELQKLEVSDSTQVSKNYDLLGQVIKSDITDFEEIELDWMVDSIQVGWINLRDYYVSDEIRK